MSLLATNTQISVLRRGQDQCMHTTHYQGRTRCRVAPTPASEATSRQFSPLLAVRMKLREPLFDVETATSRIQTP